MQQQTNKKVITNNKNKNIMKNIKHGTEEIIVTNKVYGSYSIRNNKLVIYKGYKSNIYYLTYSNVSIMTDKNVAILLDRFDEYINTFDTLDNQMKEITDKVNEPLYCIWNRKEDKTISIYKVLGVSDSLEMLETSEIQGGRYAIRNKENGAYKFGLSFEAAKYIFNNK